MFLFEAFVAIVIESLQLYEAIDTGSPLVVAFCTTLVQCHTQEVGIDSTDSTQLVCMCVTQGLRHAKQSFFH